MTWTWPQFLLWLGIAYFTYYAVVILYDLFLNKPKGADDDDVELVHNENIIAKDAESIEDLPNTYKGQPSTQTPVAKPAVLINSPELLEEDQDQLDVVEPFNETSSTGGILVKDLFRMHKQDAAQLANSIMF
ncbi:hypothetical protein N180_20945 [Pedobacter antarcticus 4BY]|uniref:Uncharacterized protein n=2 Tax=Pedobacter antarcticus TaxID=34086 RepID=A0A081PIC0_9SPHI|nr:hypothetical protein [Pedobacter antarcticus]KEQ30443.1 hypothetical protein N180_20945 [Pedobacter antarcticus 4BY]SFF48655.1 hypothetical protein SAMN03003324_04157 [Pedobacter antarcticus]